MSPSTPAPSPSVVIIRQIGERRNCWDNPFPVKTERSLLLDAFRWMDTNPVLTIATILVVLVPFIALAALVFLMKRSKSSDSRE